MKEELKQKWIAALRSGDYVQGQQALRPHRSDGWAYCCLGVLCDIDENVRWQGREALFQIDDGPEHYDDAELPLDYLDHIELNEEIASSLAQMNDNDGLNFAQIADWIEEHA